MAYLREKIEAFIQDKTAADPYQERRHHLAWLLRHPEKWPSGFEWDYEAVESCAMGLCHAAGMIELPREAGRGFPVTESIETTGKYLGLKNPTDIFMYAHYDDDLPCDCASQVTPAMIADLLERN